LGLSEWQHDRKETKEVSMVERLGDDRAASKRHIALEETVGFLPAQQTRGVTELWLLEKIRLVANVQGSKFLNEA